MKCYNKGEWSELYVLFKLLSQPTILSATKKEYTISAIDRFDGAKTLKRGGRICRRYSLSSAGLIRVVSGGVLKEIKIPDFKKKVDSFLSEIASGENKGSFACPTAALLMTSLGIIAVKAQSKDKSDLHLIINTPGSTTETEGFSIKSDFGGSPTLLNASQATNFVYEVTGLTPADCVKYSKLKSKTLIKSLIAAGYSLKFIKALNQQFEDNLTVDTTRIFGQIVLDYYSSDVNTVKALCTQCRMAGHLQVDRKVKDVLNSVALGMVPKTEWNGIISATGGYILVIKPNGDLKLLPFKNTNSFRSYLYENTRLDTPSSTRHRHSCLYISDEKVYVNLNLQIRFMPKIIRK